MTRSIFFSLLSLHFLFPGTASALSCANVFTIHEQSYIRSADTFYVADIHNAQYGFRAVLDKYGVLNISAKLVRMTDGHRSELKGHELYDKMIEHFGRENITAIQGTWVQRASHNYEQFLEGLSKGLSESEAALGTWSGHKAAMNGFGRVKEPITTRVSSSGLIIIDVVFLPSSQ